MKAYCEMYIHSGLSTIQTLNSQYGGSVETMTAICLQFCDAKISMSLPGASLTRVLKVIKI